MSLTHLPILPTAQLTVQILLSTHANSIWPQRLSLIKYYSLLQQFFIFLQQYFATAAYKRYFSPACFFRPCYIRLALPSVLKSSTKCNTLPKVPSSPHGNYINSNLPALPYCFITSQDSKAFSNTGSTFYLAHFQLSQNTTAKVDNGFHWKASFETSSSFRRLKKKNPFFCLRLQLEEMSYALQLWKFTRK